jgi:hypothetical protein
MAEAVAEARDKCIPYKVVFYNAVLNKAVFSINFQSLCGNNDADFEQLAHKPVSRLPTFSFAAEKRLA